MAKDEFSMGKKESWLSESIKKEDKKHRHVQSLIYPGEELRGPILRIVRRRIVPTVGEQIETVLKEAFSKPMQCSRCGGMLPDLMFVLGKRTYKFTCWQITEKDRVIAETDYEKLGAYCQAVVGNGSV
jgi:hypothetical protein